MAPVRISVARTTANGLLAMRIFRILLCDHGDCRATAAQYRSEVWVGTTPEATWSPSAPVSLRRKEMRLDPVLLSRDAARTTALSTLALKSHEGRRPELARHLRLRHRRRRHGGLPARQP